MRADPDPRISAAARKIAAVLADLEAETGGKVEHVDLHNTDVITLGGRPAIITDVVIVMVGAVDRQWSTGPR